MTLSQRWKCAMRSCPIRRADDRAACSACWLGRAPENRRLHLTKIWVRRLAAQRGRRSCGSLRACEKYLRAA